MKISAKTRYAVAAMINMAQLYEGKECVTVVSLAENLSISKIYLEQVFSLLKRGHIVTAVKGAQGGYRLARPPRDITLFEVMSAIELSLFAESEKTVERSAASIEQAMKTVVFDPLDAAIRQTLSAATLADLVGEAEKHAGQSHYMYYL